MDEAGAMPDVSSWADDATYALLGQADRATFAWEFGRRESGFAGAASVPPVPIAPHIALVEAQPPTSLPGLRFALPSAGDSALPAVQWDWTCDPSVLPVIAIPSAGGFDLRDIPFATVVLCRAGGREHVLIADGPRCIRIEVRCGTLLGGPVRLDYHLHGDNDVRAKIMTLRRLAALCRLGRFPATLFPPERRARRWAMALQAWDGRRTGASHRDIACVLRGEAAVRDEWYGESDHMRTHIKRLLRTANTLIGGGWRYLLRQQNAQLGVSPENGRPRSTALGSCVAKLCRAAVPPSRPFR